MFPLLLSGPLPYVRQHIKCAECVVKETISFPLFLIFFFFNCFFFVFFLFVCLLPGDHFLREKKAV